MKRNFSRLWLLPVLSAVLTYFNICTIGFFFSWICYIPLFSSILDSSHKQSFRQGFIFGFALSVGCFFWMIPGAERFTGHSIVYGLCAFLIFAIFLSLYYGAVLYCFALLKNKNVHTNAVAINSVFIAALFVISEALLSILAVGLPWFSIHSGNGLAANIYSIQPASIFGIHILTFVVVLVNYLFALCIANRVWIRVFIPIAFITVYMLAGFFLQSNFESKSNSHKSFKVAILAENIPPEIKWDETSGNFLVQKLLNLNRTAVTLKPDITLWSESAIPWTYRKDDDLVKEILSITSPAHVTHILGINTEYKDNIIFNSAYCILPDGKVTSRYDKQYLLSFIEKPFGGFLMPFFSSNGFSAVSNVQHAAPLSTPYGRAGVFVCNEAAVPSAATKMVKQGAQFLVNMSNDGWFNDTYIVRLHFYYARLRAVESRKDLAINCNNGYSGMIKASGAIVEQDRSEESFVKMAELQPNNILTIASAYPNLLVYCSVAYIILVATMRVIDLNKLKEKQNAYIDVEGKKSSG